MKPKEKLKAGWCKDTDVTHLLHFWEAENVKKSGELMRINLVIGYEKATLI
ncbi:hypothetical protein DY000_02039843 [Brassica cretica]|uniref:Uncharacterized protein n=1 Tax=Brassica cretica TaxID=69181 RepID=A0ABQ7BFV5_BRACR|nr:hypothetical protein DY000_02039843 [Brassica cretica]